MPITPLHFGVLAPINHFAPGKVSNAAFILTTLWLDAQAIAYWIFGLPLPDHTPTTHSFIGAIILATAISVLGFRSRKWILGCLIAGVTHIALDMLVHSEMIPLWPMPGNPFYMGWMEPLSVSLLALTIWLIVQTVSYTLGWLRKRQEAEFDGLALQDLEEH
jgi:membrane-bound metal-dependent hydrolase YbcI (DUF457 family)